MRQETGNCQNCKADFVVEEADLTFYEKIQVPSPTFCPQCRLIRRLAWRNERSLYKRPCNLCKKEKIGVYRSETPIPAYCRECWWSDKWDGKQYARDYDFSKPFFMQFKELLSLVPRPGILQQGTNPGSEYANRVTDNRECYLVFGTTTAEYCRYGTWLNGSKECMDCYNTQKSERCYECTDVLQCNSCAFCRESNECSNSWFLFNCRNLTDCFGCVNLRNKSYCFFNQQLTKEKYQRRVKQANLGNAQKLEEVKKQFEAFRKQFVVPSLVNHHSNNVSGNWIESCKNLKDSFSCRNVEEGAYCFSVFAAKDAMDYCFWGNGSELMYECSSVGNQCGRARFCFESWDQAFDMEYCGNCHNSQYLFGCVGLRNARYCILNRQYEKNEYEAMVDKIKKHMREMPYVEQRAKGKGQSPELGEGQIEYRYGEFFPPELSPFGYNETVAQEFFPKSKERAIRDGFSWKDPIEKNYQITLEASALIQDITQVKKEITKELIGCEHKGSCQQQCTVAFRILPDELKFYHWMKLPLPRLCPNCRHYERLAKRTPLNLWTRSCSCAGKSSQNNSYQNTSTHFHKDSPCPNTFETSYHPDRPEIVYCESCYQHEVA